ncbi:MAG: Hsp20/alpha crystallin family protein [Chitinophagaceae bacterium]|nr:Hsp20/alpha crystallin family protein [Chitinophagaceae bacterium]
MYTNQFTDCGSQSRSMKREFHGYHPFFKEFRRPKYNVPINIIENENDFEVHVFASGFAKDDIRITVTNDVLFISGVKVLPDDYKPNFSRQEFPIKNFERSLALNNKVDAALIAAKYENGVLIIMLPKNEEAKVQEKVIEVM